MDEDAQIACWHQLELEQREQFEREQELLRKDPFYEQWLMNQETVNETSSKSRW